MKMENSIVLGVDVGGTHVTSALVNVHLGAIVEGSQNRLSLNSNGIANEILDTIENCIRISAGSHLLQHMSLGFAMPGPFDYENGICKIVQQEKFRSLYELPLKEILSQRLKLPQNAIYFMNDACSFLEGELWGLPWALVWVLLSEEKRR